MAQDNTRDIPLKRDGQEIFELSRHRQRPNIYDYIDRVFTDFTELHGDRLSGDDGAMLCGIARFKGLPVTVIGQVKGKNVSDNIKANFGMARPEGYRKAMRQMRLAEKFNRPVITFVDTPGADCGVEAEERGQAEAIAANLRDMMGLRVPVISVIIGEGGSGGALGIACANRVLMLENSTYTVISPKGFASILWKDGSREKEAARILRMTAKDLLELGVIDAIVDEPAAGAHTDYDYTAARLSEKIEEILPSLLEKSGTLIYNDRYDKFRKMGCYNII